MFLLIAVIYFVLYLNFLISLRPTFEETSTTEHLRWVFRAPTQTYPAMRQADNIRG